MKKLRHKDEYKVTWVTKSFSPLIEHRLLLRDVSQQLPAVLLSLIFCLQHSEYSAVWQELEVPLDPRGHGLAFFHQLAGLRENASYTVAVQARNTAGWSRLSARHQFHTANTTIIGVKVWTKMSS